MYKFLLVSHVLPAENTDILCSKSGFSTPASKAVLKRPRLFSLNDKNEVFNLCALKSKYCLIRPPKQSGGSKMDTILIN